MSPQALIYFILMVLVLVLVCVILVYAIEHFIAPIDPKIKGIAALILFILILLYALQHFGLLGARW